MKSKPKMAAPPAQPAAKPKTLSNADAEILLGKAHRVLLHYRPGVALPDQLARVRAMLDAHMFGRDTREVRDDVVEIARQIDEVLPAQIFPAPRR